jgi:hypothetical protein
MESVKTAIGNLYTADAVASRFYLPLPSVKELSANGFMPHYRIRGIEEPLFELHETKEWVAENLIEHTAGEKLPSPKIVVVRDGVDSSVVGLAPTSISSIAGLMRFNPELFSGVYFLCLKNEVVYVGQSTAIPSRIKQHSDKQYDRVFFLRVPSSQLLEVENRFIKALNPKLNRTRKGDHDRTEATA